jgi:ATP-binding cassette, subfamily C (CFTR/MRP), member 1
LGVFAAQLAFLVLRATQKDVQTSASLAGDLLRLAGAIGAAVLSFLDHRHSLRPSTLLSLYLSTIVLLDIGRVRTLWQMRTGAGPSTALSATLAFATVSLLIESIERHRGIVNEKSEYAPEQLSGFWNRTSFAWLVATFRAGHSKIISLDDLPILDTNLRSRVVGAQLEATWAKCN